ncbi:MAG: hypothetical protein CMH54_14945, partial [Myxococcales bacterium]|nr:hypothetical protein [Myxococcales bacterium]
MLKRILGVGFLGLVLTGFSLSGCGSSKSGGGSGGGGGGVNCTSACNHVLKLAKAEASKEIANLPAEQKKMAADMMSKQMDGMKGACVEECK